MQKSDRTILEILRNIGTYGSLAFRNLRRQKRRTILLGGAIAFGLFIVTMINGFTGSFIENVGENFSHFFAGHIFIEGVKKTPTGKQINIIEDDSILMETIQELNIDSKYITKRSDFQGTLIFEGESVTQSVTGADWQTESYLRDRMVLVDGSFEGMENRKGLIITERIAEKLNVQIGDRMLMQMTTAMGQQNVGDFVLVGISHDPGLFGSMSCYANIDYVTELLNVPQGQYMVLGLFLYSMDSIAPVSEALYAALEKKVNMFSREKDDSSENMLMSMMRQGKEDDWEGVRFRLYTLNDMLEEIQQLVNVLNTVALVILITLFMIVMVGIFNTFRMIMFERTKEIGTMRALGMQRTGIRGLFLLEAVFLTFGGALIGHIMAGIAMGILSVINWGLDSPISVLLKNGFMTFRLNPLQVIFNIVLVALMTLAAAYLPANKAARLEPADALRSIN